MDSEESAIQMDIFGEEQENDSDSSTSSSSDDSSSDSDEKTEGDIQDHNSIRDMQRCSTFAGLKIDYFFEGDRIKVGLRVVRGVDWDKGDEDGGEGNVGTVVEILNNSQQVRVQWDSQDTLDIQKNPDKCIYRTGMDWKYDLRLFDNAQTGVLHNFIGCVTCDETPIRGMRWRCLDCFKYDLCTECYMYDVHNLDHAFERIDGMRTMGVNVGIRTDAHNVAGSGIFPYSDIRSRKDPKLRGTVETVDDDIVTMYNCDAKVKWEGGDTKRYRVGRDGKVDIKFTEPANVKYFEDHLQGISKDNAVEGIRVVERSDKDHVTVGTITNVTKVETEPKRGRLQRFTMQDSFSLHQNVKPETEENSAQHCIVTVQWDDGKRDENVATNEKELLLFDNRQIDHIEKQGATCDECKPRKRKIKNIKGMRWKCAECPDYDLCTPCYMSAKDDHINHKFQRITEPTKRKKLETSRGDPKVKVRTARGIFEGATVQELNNDTETKGKVEKLCHYKVNNARCIVVMEKDDDDDEVPNIKGPFTDFQSEDENCTFFYPSHLPDLGKDILGYVKVEDKPRSGEILVQLWFQKDICTSLSAVKHSLYLIFAHKQEDASTTSSSTDETRFQPLEDVMKFARKSHLPCQLAIEKVLFFEEAVVVHKDTTNDTIQELVKWGFRKFVRGEMEEDENEGRYFLRMFLYISDKVPLPVFVSIRNGVVLSTDALVIAARSHIPVICFKSKSRSVNVLTMIEGSFSIKGLKHKFDLMTPWKITDTRIIEYNLESSIIQVIDDEITRPDDIPRDPENVPALISTLLIAVYMNTNSEERTNIFGEKAEIYPNALSMYLLRTGQWLIPTNCIMRSFNRRSIEYIFEKKMTADFENGLWKELELKTKSAYVTPVWQKGKTDFDEDEDEENEEDYISEGILHMKNRELFGLIFYALLKKRYYDGAKQLIETGYVRIPHLLIGSVILQETADDSKTSPLQKKKALLMKAMCTQQALRITRCVHEGDIKSYRKTRDVYAVGESDGHAGRLLLNHGYLADAIKTENRAYLNDEIVKTVINQMSFKYDSISFRRAMLFFILTMFHGLLLLPLMITMENKPLQWLYRQYQVPVMKVLLNAFGWLMILIALAYMLLFDFMEGISKTDWFIIAWMTSFLFDETKQVIISMKRKKIGFYLKNWWNRLDWLTMALYFCGMLIKLGRGEIYYNASKVLLVSTFILLCVRFLNSLTISEVIGAKLVMIRKMFIDTFAFFAIMAVIVPCYSVSYYAILYSGNSDLSFTQIERVFRNGFWILFGELSLENDRLKEPDCTFNKTIYNNGEVDRCPSEMGLFLAPYLKAGYALLAIVLLLNLLIAMYSYTFMEVHTESKFYWTLLQTDLLEEYSVKSIFPIHFQLLVLPVCFVHFLFWIPLSYLRSKYGCDYYDEFTQDPMFVRVFLYDRVFDLKFEQAVEAEVNAALKSSSDLKVIDEDEDEDKLTVLQRKMMDHKRITVECTSEILQEIQQMKRDIQHLYKAVLPDTAKEEEDGTISKDMNNTDIDTD